MHKRYLTVLATLFAALIITAVARAGEPAPQPGVPLPGDVQAPEINDGECLGANLLSNPSFEGNYSAYVPPNGNPDCPSGTCGTAQMASSWTPFWYSGIPTADAGTLTNMPEYKPAEAWFVDPARVRSGERAQQYFTFYKVHNAGIYQQVAVTPGVSYCFSVWGHSWSANDDDDAYSGPFHGQLNQYVGIDPYGGTDPNGGSVVWGPPRYQYDTYAAFQVGAVAQASTLTVFMRSDAFYAVKHNDVYWDDAALTTMSFAVDLSGNAWFVQEVGSGRAEQRSFAIAMTGPPDMTWSATVQAGATAPISFVSASGGAGDDLQIVVNGSGLGAGVYTGTVVLSPSEPIPGTPVLIPVRLVMAPNLVDYYMPLGVRGP